MKKSAINDTKSRVPFIEYKLSCKPVYLYWLLVVSYMALIFYMSSLSEIKYVPDLSHGLDKLVHLTEYGIFGWILYRAFRYASPYSKYASILAIIFATLYGISDEFHQKFVPGRMYDPWDAVSNSCGAVLAQLISIRKDMRLEAIPIKEKSDTLDT